LNTDTPMKLDNISQMNPHEVQDVVLSRVALQELSCLQSGR
jgi:hypothetical protein